MRPHAFLRAAIPSTWILVLAPSPGRLEEPSIRDEWHLLSIEGQPAGYIHVSARPLPEGGTKTVLEEKLVLGRAGTKVEIRTRTAVEEDSAGKFAAFESEQELSRSVARAYGRVDAGEVAIEQSAGGGASKSFRIPLDPEAVGPQRADREMRRALGKPGDSSEATLFFPEVLKFGKQKAVLGPTETVEVRGAKKALRRVTVTQDILPGVAVEQWFDDAFELQRSTMSAFGLRFVTYRATAEEVLRERFSSPPEIFLSTSAPARGKSPSGASEALYRLAAKGERFPAGPDSHLFRGTGQELVREDGPKARVVRVKRIPPPRGVPYPLPARPELAEHLRPNAYIQSDDPEIARVAKEVAGGEKDAWEAARKLERWVRDNVREKNLATAFASAREVLRAKEGDCTEHAVLLAALLRAAGLPSRVVGGLVYQGRAFVGHMWTEVHLGSWIPLDATLGPGPPDADRLAFVASTLHAQTAADFFIGLVPLIGSLEIEVLDASP